MQTASRDSIVANLKRYSDLRMDIFDSDGNRVGFLNPIGEDYKEKHNSWISLMTKWRNENPSLSNNEFLATDERTGRYLDNVVLRDNSKLLFIIENNRNIPIGHIGLADIDFGKNSTMVYSVLRGSTEGCPGMMGYALQRLLNFSKDELGIEYIYLFTKSDNERAVRLYSRNGFVKTQTFPLKKVIEPDETKWVRCEESESDGRYEIKMLYGRTK